MPQNEEQKEDLNNQISKVRELITTTPQQRILLEIEQLIEQAQHSRNREAELTLLSTKYEYYYFHKTDFEKMLESARELQSVSQKYNHLRFIGISHKYIAQVYLFNGFYDKTESELHQALEVLGKAPVDDAIIIEKARIHTAFANLYNIQKGYEKSIQSLLFSNKEHQKLTDPEQRRGTTFMDYANLGGAYLYVNTDSAEYYAKKSDALKTTRESDHNLTFLNYVVLAQVYQQRKDYETALDYYKKAEAIKENKHFLNIQELYQNIIQVYDSLQDSGTRKEYELKLQELQLSVYEQKNRSLRTILTEDMNGALKEEDSENNYSFLYFLVITLIASTAVMLVVIYKKRKKNQKGSLSPNDYNHLIHLLEKQDPTFMGAFEQHYPEFSARLLKLNPDLSFDEIELLAMIKMNLSGKEIAKYKFIQPKTIQNRRYRVRKKIELPTSDSLDKWVKNF